MQREDEGGEGERERVREMVRGQTEREKGERGEEDGENGRQKGEKVDVTVSIGPSHCCDRWTPLPIKLR